MQIRHKSTGQTLEVYSAVEKNDGTLMVEVSEGDLDFDRLGRSAWEIVVPTNDEIVSALKPGSVFHYESEDGLVVRRYFKSTDTICYAENFGEVATVGNWGITKIVVDFQP